MRWTCIALIAIAGFGSGAAPACTSGRSLIPPPAPNQNGSYLWDADTVVMYGVIAGVERNFDRWWIERLAIRWGLLNQPYSPGGLTPRHRVDVAKAHYFVGSGGSRTAIELRGCSLPIPKIGERVLFLSEGRGRDRSFNPVYESDGQQFIDRLRALEAAAAKSAERRGDCPRRFLAGA